MAGIGWIDFSPDHRDKVASVIDLLKPEGKIDELGIGVIRDALSDAFFPGFSTIQTRAKYFLIVPRILKEYQIQYGNRKSRPALKEYLRTRENQILRFLAEKYRNTNEQGIFGITLVGTTRELARKPSSIYWSGLRLFNIVNTHLSLTEYIARQDRQESLVDLLAMTDDEKGDDLDAGYEDPFGIKLPYNHQDGDQDLSIELEYEEADFLRDKIIDNHHDKLIGQVLKNIKLMDLFVKTGSFRDLCDVFWEKEIPIETKRLLSLAKDFDKVIHGAHIRYNCLLQERFGTDDILREFSNDWDVWWDRLIADEEMIRNFDEDRLLELAVTLKPFTRDFVKDWIEGLRRSETVEFFDRLTIDQEKNNKLAKARLRSGATERVSGWIGIDGLSYRFPAARDIVRDIQHGLGK